MQDLKAAAHTVVIDNRSRANVTGITAIDSFNEKQVTARLEGAGIVIGGEGLSVTKFNTENGTLTVDGKINEVRYTEGAGGKAARAIKRLFK